MKLSNRAGSVIAYAFLTMILMAGAAQSLSGSNTVTTDDIVDNNVTSADFGTNSVTKPKIADNAVGTNEIVDEGVRSEDVKDHSLTAADFAIGVAGPKASGRVDQLGAATRVHGAAVTASKLDTGFYCVEVAGASPSTDVMVATVDFSQSPTTAGGSSNATVEVHQNATCNTNGWRVLTFKHNDASTPSVTAADAGFTFVVN